MLVRYTEAMARKAVGRFVWRRILLGSPLLPAALVIGGSACFSAWYGGAPFLTGAMAASSFALLLFVAVLWRAHWTNTVGKCRRMNPPEAELTFQEDCLMIRSNLGAATVSWSSFVEVWRLPAFWMLFFAPNSFMTIPVGEMRAEDLRYLQDRLEQHVPRGTMR